MKNSELKFFEAIKLFNDDFIGIPLKHFKKVYPRALQVNMLMIAS